MKRAQQPDTVAADHLLLKKPRCSLIPLSMELAMSDEDMLTEILVRLPAKSLIRFKSVCKKWRIIISSDYFCHHHTLRRPKLQRSLILQTLHGWEFFYFNQAINGEKTIIPYAKRTNLPNHKIVQACNGLMLLQVPKYKYMRGSSCDFYNPTTTRRSKTTRLIDRDRYYVYNPTTRQSREINVTQKNEYPRFVAIGLAFDPSKSPYYNIVCIRSTAQRNLDSGYYTLQIEVYDSESHRWKVSLEAVTFSTISFTYGEYWNNSIYWISQEGCCHYDIDKNEMKTLMPFPAGVIGIVEGLHTIPSFDLQVSDGHLYLMKWILKYPRAEDKYGAESVLVWELGGDDDSQWPLKYHHHYDDRIMNTNIVRLLVGSDGGDETCSLLTKHRDGKMRAFNIIDKTYEDIFDFKTHLDLADSMLGSMLGFQFGEILALV